MKIGELTGLDEVNLASSIATAKRGTKQLGSGKRSTVWAHASDPSKVVKLCPRSDEAFLDWVSTCREAKNPHLPAIYDVIEAHGPRLAACLGKAPSALGSIRDALMPGKDDGVAVVMEKLSPIKPFTDKHQIFVQLSKLFWYDHNRNAMAEGDMAKVAILIKRYELQKVATEQGIVDTINWFSANPLYLDALQLASHSGHDADINSENMMLRGDLPVLIDPLC